MNFLARLRLCATDVMRLALTWPYVGVYDFELFLCMLRSAVDTAAHLVAYWSASELPTHGYICMGEHGGGVKVRFSASSSPFIAPVGRGVIESEGTSKCFAHGTFVTQSCLLRHRHVHMLPVTSADAHVVAAMGVSVPRVSVSEDVFP